MAAKKFLFIEGESDGYIHKGFTTLLKQKIDGSLPRIVMGGGKQSVIDKFLNNRLEGKSYLLCDLDKPEESKEQDIEDFKITKHKENVFYMIQELESWFLSQPDILDKYYGVTTAGKKVSENIKKRKPAGITNPKEVLKEITQKLNKGEEYHELSHAVELLELLDATKLENDFPDFKRLIEKLK